MLNRHVILPTRKRRKRKEERNIGRLRPDRQGSGCFVYLSFLPSSFSFFSLFSGPNIVLQKHLGGVYNHYLFIIYCH